ncbi:HNH endonuclease [Amycolatopsis sp. cg5]|uniref:HNH endonuclease n=1 Tax=Amycolatopsis sp. cg5 TaxID=3238802 RepID=UPI0035244712
MLREMAAGCRFCMYCGETLGSAIDHHQPIAMNPARTFDWLNHLLACDFCNSHYKRDQYPVDAAGHCLLIDPTAEDPLDHLFLVLSLGKYRALTDKGAATIKVCGLDRPLLERGRQRAFQQVKYAVAAWDRGDDRAKSQAAWTLREQPHADVFHAMLRQADSPGAREIFDGDDVLIARLRRFKDS